MEKSFRRTMDVLEDVFAFVSNFAAQNGLSDSVAFKLNVAIEELFVNMLKHNPGGSRDVLISLTKDEDRLVASLTDFDVEPFDVTKVDAYDRDEPLDKRPIGHLGIHLAKSMVDEISYQYSDGQSIITLIKDLG